MAVTYKNAGVDIKATDRLLARLAPLVRSTHGPEVLPDRGQFAGLFRLSLHRWREPVLLASTDGVGTKLKVAQWLGEHTAIGVDAVAMNVNDVIVYGAQPLFFLDYIGIGKLNARVMTQLLRGITQGCRESGCALLGGETAQMPGVYRDGEYDVAGFCVGAVERRKLIDGSHVRAGDVVVGLASSGIHANGFSLVRKVLSQAELKRHKRALLAPTRIYVKPILRVLQRIRVTALAHITGGGLARRLPSVVARQPQLRVSWAPNRWPVPAIFRIIQQAGRIAHEEMYTTFNMGIGMALTCRRHEVSALLQIVRRLGLPAWVIGTIERSHDATTQH